MKTQKSSKRKQSIKCAIIILMVLFSINANAQNNSVGIGTLVPDNSAILHLEKSDQGFLMTRLDSSQIYGIVTPAKGLITYNTEDNCYWYYNSTSWKRICTTDSLVNSSVTTNNINVDSLISNYINVNNINTDTIYNNYFYGNVVYGDTAIFNYGDVNILNTDTIYNNYFYGNVVYGDTAIFNYGNVNILNTDTIYNNYLYGNVIYGDSVISNSVYTDSLFLGGTNITTVITDSIASQAWLLHGNLGTNPSTFFLGTKDNQALVFRTNNTEATRILSTGEVGINTTAPTQKLDVNGRIRLRTGAVNGYILQSDAIGAASWVNPSTLLTTTTLNPVAWTILGNTLTNPAVNFVGTIDNVDFVTRTNNVEKMRVLATGEVGINTTAPTQKLDVNGKIRLRTGAVNTYILQSDAIGTGTWINPLSLFTTAAVNPVAWTILGNTLTNPAVNFVGTIDNVDFVTRTNNVEKMRVLATGEVGINTTAPTQKLDVNGKIRLRTGAVNTYILQSDAIGTGTWIDPLSLFTTAAVNPVAWTILGNTLTNPAINFVGTIDNVDFVTRTNNIERMRVTNSGRVGVGLAVPLADVHVTGSLGLLYTGTTGVGTIPVTGAGERFMYYPKKAALRAGRVTGADWDDANVGLYSIANGTDNQAAGTNSATFGTLNDNLGTNGFIAGQGNTLSNVGTAQIALGRNNSISSAGSFGDFFIGDGNVSTAGQNQGALGRLNTVSVNNSYAFGQNITITGPGAASGNMIVGYNFNTNNQSNVFHFGANNTNASTNIYFFGSNNTNTNAYNATDYSFIFGRSNTLNDGNSVVIGHNNSINTNLSSAYHYVLGFNNQIIGTANSGSFAIGIGCIVNNTHNASMAIGNSASTTGSNQLIGRFSGGVRLESNGVGTSGVVLAPGGGAWAAVSDRKMKENIKSISDAEILKKLMSVEVTEWNYITQQADTMNKYLASIGLHYDKAPVHIGPMAQDFSEVFGYGEFKDKITSTDIDGVMFASIKALAEQNKALKLEVMQLGEKLSEVEELKKQLEELKKLLNDSKTH